MRFSHLKAGKSYLRCNFWVINVTCLQQLQENLVTVVILQLFRPFFYSVFVSVTPVTSLLSFPRTFKPFGKEQLLTNLYKIRRGKGAEFCSGENSEGSQGAVVAASGYSGSRHV